MTITNTNTNNINDSNLSETQPDRLNSTPRVQQLHYAKPYHVKATARNHLRLRKRLLTRNTTKCTFSRTLTTTGTTTIPTSQHPNLTDQTQTHAYNSNYSTNTTLFTCFARNHLCLCKHLLIRITKKIYILRQRKYSTKYIANTNTNNIND